MKDYYIIVFYSSQQAMYFLNKLKYLGLNVAVMPTPRGITQGCSYSIRFEKKDMSIIQSEYDKIKFPISGIYKISLMYGRYKILSKIL